MNYHDQSQHNKILVVDDDPGVLKILTEALQLDGFCVTPAADGDAMTHHLDTGNYALVLLDIGLPGHSGLDLVRELRSHTDAPVIFVSGRSSDVDRIVGLELGADDYIVKPFNVREVTARVRAVLRRSGKQKPSPKRNAQAPLQIGDLSVEPRTRSFRGPAGTQIVLTPAEFALLEFLHKYSGRVCSRDDITAGLKGHDWSPLDRSLDTLVARLRKKIENNSDFPVHVVTVRGTGYKLHAD